MGQAQGQPARSARCIALVGPYLSGKTTLLEAILARTGAIGRQGTMTEAVIDYATGDERTSAFVRRFAEMGAPWHFGVDDLEELAGEAHMSRRSRRPTEAA